MLSILVKTRLQSLFNSMFGRMLQKKKRSPGMKALMALLAVYVIAAIAFSLGMYCKMMVVPLVQMGMGWLYFAIMTLMSMVFCFVGSIFITQSQLFNARDNELLLSMPIPPSHILASRMLTLLALNYVYTLIFMGPAIVVYIIEVGMSAAAIACAVAAVLVMPLLSMTLSCVCGLVIGAVSSRVKRNNFVTIFLFVGFFAAYMYFFMNLQTYMTTLIQQGTAIGDAVGRAFPPAYWAGMAATGHLPSLGLFVLCCVVPFVLVYMLISRSFISIITTKKGGVRVKYKERAMKKASAFSALLRREAARYFGLPIYVFNSGIGTFMHIILAVAVVWKGPGIITALFSMPGAEGLGALIPALACLVLAFCSIMIIPSSVSISLEGKNLWITRSAPVSSMQVLNAKLALNLLCGIPSGLIASLALVYALPVNAAQAAIIILLPVAISAFVAVFGLVCNLLLPRLDWVSEAVVVKQSGSALATVFGAMAILALPVILYAALLNRFLAMDTYLVICLAAFALAAAALYGWIRHKGVRRFESL